MVRRAFAQLRAMWTRPPTADRGNAISHELARIERQLERFTQAVQLGGDLATLVEQIRRLEQCRANLHAERDSAQRGPATPMTAYEIAELEAEVLARLAEWQRLMRRHPHETRQRLSEVLTKRMVWMPREDADGRLLVGFAGGPRPEQLDAVDRSVLRI